jgi:YVTN family beta-propeller protein
MDVYLLGPIEARLDGRPIALGAPKQRAVLAMLALRVGRTVSADRLAQGLWGELQPPSAAKMVQLYVSHLRRLLDGTGAEIVTHGRGYELRLTDGEVDAIRFERLLEQGRAREALALWRGEALADVADEPFAGAEIRRLEELRVRAAEEAIDADLAAGLHAEVVGELAGLVAAHPLREKLHAQRMLALYRSGRQSEALEAYQAARTALVDQIGVEPGPELRQLQEAILAQDPALELAVRSPAGGSPTPAPALLRRRTAPVLAFAVFLLLAGVLGFVVSRVTQPDRLGRIDENSVGLIDPDDGRITEQYPVGRGPAAVVAGGGSIWVANALDGTVSRVDRERGQVVTIDVGGEPTAVAFGNRALWVANGEGSSIAQIDPGTNRVVETLEAGNAPRAVAVGFGALWVASAIDGSVRRIDLAHSATSRSIPVGLSPTSIAAGAGAIWVASEEAGTVTRLDPRTGAVARAINVGNGTSAVAVGRGVVWAANRPDGTVSRIDPRTNAVSGTVPAGGDPVAIAVAGGDVWVAGGGAGTVSRIDSDTLRILQTIAVKSGAAAVAIAGGAVWAAAVTPPAGHRGGSLRVLLGRPVPIDWLDRTSFFYPTPQLVSLAYDGLVAYRRVGGAAGATLVGALATDVPVPSRDGRTYIFTMRPGLRYSDGSAVRPGDFRASIERFLRVTRRTFPPFYAGIVGAERCIERPARCDLSAGIETDPRTRTITIHLTRPDAEFLHKLTLQFAYVIPAATPIRRTGDRAPPGTGPYQFAAWDKDRGGRLVRNPYFRSWSPRARPVGFADGIEVSLYRRGQVRAQIAEVERGSADVVFLADAFEALLPPQRLRALKLRSPGQLHTHPEAVLNYMFLNVLLPPFDDIRVRRALNYATDRGRIVELEGGREIASPTCQILPSGFPGYRSYCPYTAQPAPGRAWTAPDMERARELVAASGTARERVIVQVPDFKPSLGRYFARLLNELGYRATARVLDQDAYFRLINAPRPRVQIGFLGYSADYAAPSTFIQPNFTCASPADPQKTNVSHFCDRSIARQVDRALAAQGADAAGRWAAIDHRLADMAPAVPLTNRRSMELVSRRLGNVQHLQGYTMLDQLWVH